VEYLVVEECSASELTVAVNRLIERGWRPVGGVATQVWTRNGDPDFGYVQAMTRAVPQQSMGPR
jgi:hypothetical protein